MKVTVTPTKSSGRDTKTADAMERYMKWLIKEIYKVYPETTVMRDIYYMGDLDTHRLRLALQHIAKNIEGGIPS